VIEPKRLWLYLEVIIMMLKQATNKRRAAASGSKLVIAAMGALLLLVGGAALSGCAGNYGRFNRSFEVTAAFQAGQPYPDYNYYFAGREGRPYAIIGIDKTYQVSSRLWKAFTPTSEKLRSMTAFVYDIGNDRAYGANILAPSGERIGVWYSKIVFVHAKVDEDNKVIDVVFKDPELEEAFVKG
jgi:hypothetical protein